MIYTTIALVIWLWHQRGQPPPWWISLAIVIDGIVMYPTFRESVILLLVGE